jgi:hypothetical protein
VSDTNYLNYSTLRLLFYSLDYSRPFTGSLHLLLILLGTSPAFTLTLHLRLIVEVLDPPQHLYYYSL